MRFFVRYAFFILLIGGTGCQKEDQILDEQEDNSNEEQIGDDSSGSLIVANDFLSDKKYDKLIVEIQFIEGFQPKATSVDRLKTFLQERLKKPAGISVTENAIPSPGLAAYSLEDIREVEKAGRTQQPHEKTLTAYIFFADGDYAGNSGDSKVLGIAYGRTSMVIFEKTIKEYSGGLTQPPVGTLESTVIQHELGHTLGLVNNGTSMESEHQDEPHGKHCNDKNCLMYYTAETTDIVGNLTGGNVPELDANCLEDLRANGGN